MKRLFLFLSIALVVYLAFLLLLFVKQDGVVFVVRPEPVPLPSDSPYTAEAIQTEDGETLVAWSSPADTGCPTLLMFHGNAEQLWPNDPELRLLHQHGLGFLRVAFRGYSGSTGTPSEQGVLADARAAYQYLGAAGIAPENIVVRGFSLGASPSTMLAAEQDIGALILGAPFLSAVQMGKDHLPFVPVALILKHDFRTDRHIGNVRAPILIGHGEADKVVPSSHSARLQALAPDNTTRITFPGVDHNSLYYSGMYKQAIWPFLSPLYPNCSALQSTNGVTL